MFQISLAVIAIGVAIFTATAIQSVLQAIAIILNLGV